MASAITRVSKSYHYRDTFLLDFPPQKWMKFRLSNSRKNWIVNILDAVKSTLPELRCPNTVSATTWIIKTDLKNMFTYYLHFQIHLLRASQSLVIFNEVSEIRSCFQLGSTFSGTIGEFWFCAPRCSCQNRNVVVNWLVRTGMVRRPLLVVGGTGPLLAVGGTAGA